MSERIVGIDLGTTNSEVAYLRDGRPEVIPGEDGDPILPSFVGVARRTVACSSARRPATSTRPSRSARSSRSSGAWARTPRSRWAARNIRRPNLGDDPPRPQGPGREASGGPVGKAVVTVPAFFNDAQRQATIEAGAIAGSGGRPHPQRADGGGPGPTTPRCRPARRYLVYDLGGGTFDVSIVAVEAGVVEVLASHGDTHLGGDDFDELLAGMLAQRFETKHSVDLRSERLATARLVRAAEAAKRQLSDHPFVRVEEEFIAEREGVPPSPRRGNHPRRPTKNSSYRSSRRPSTASNAASTMLGLTAAQIDRVVLVGGSTRTPLVGEMLRDKCATRSQRRENRPRPVRGPRSGGARRNYWR